MGLRSFTLMGSAADGRALQGRRREQAAASVGGGGGVKSHTLRLRCSPICCSSEYESPGSRAPRLGRLGRLQPHGVSEGRLHGCGWQLWMEAMSG